MKGCRTEVHNQSGQRIEILTMACSNREWTSKTATVTIALSVLSGVQDTFSYLPSCEL